jgi:hypothetical protein
MIENISLVANDVSKWIAFGPTQVHRIFGYNNNASVRYIHLLEVPLGEVASGVTIPTIKSLTCQASAPFDWEFETRGLSLKELTYVPSTTELVTTFAGAGTGLDATLQIDTEHRTPASATLVGDLTTNVANLQVWSEATGAATKRKLLRLDLIDGSGVATNAVIQPTDAASTVVQSKGLLPLGVSETKSYFFGPNGLIPFSQTAAGAAKYGCTVRMALTSLGFVTNPMTFDAVTQYKIRAIHALA